MKGYFLLGILILLVSLSNAQVLDIDYPKEILLYEETTRVGITIKNVGELTQIVLPLLQTMNKGIDIETFTSVIVPRDETEFFVNIKKPINDGAYPLIIKIKEGENYTTYETILLNVVNPKQTLNILNYYSSISENKTTFEIDVENTQSQKNVVFIFSIFDLEGGRDIKETRTVDVGNKTFSFVFNLGRDLYNSERISLFRIEYDYNGKSYSTNENQIRLGSVDGYATYVTPNGLVYDMAIDKNSYKQLDKVNLITGYSSLKTGGATTLCKLYSEGSLYDRVKTFLPLDILLPSITSGALLNSYDSLNFRIKNKVCVYPEDGLLTITLLIVIIGTILLLGLNTVEPYELY